MRTKPMKSLPLAVALALVGTTASATEGFSYNGYFRGGAASSYGNHDRTCYQAPGADWKYRLGNECDMYGEFGLNYGIGKDDGPNFQLHWMPNYFTGGVSDGSSLIGGPTNPIKTEQAYVEARGMDFMPNSTFWAGSRFYGRADVHIVDTFFVNMTGTGGGVDFGLGGKPDVAASGPTLGVAYFRFDSSTASFGGFPRDVSAGGSSTGAPASRINVDFRDLTIAPNNRLRFTGVYTRGDFDAAHSPNGVKGTDGWGGSVQWNWDLPSIGGGNVLWVQYAQGSAGANMSWANTLPNSGGLTNPSSVKTQRIIESVTWQVGQLGGQGILGYTEHKIASGEKTKYISIGGRASWAFTNNFKLVGEAGYDKVDAAVGPNTNMLKLTVAPTVAFDKGFFARPEIRLYGTYGSWNGGANDAATATGTVASPVNGYGDLGNKSNGFSYGVQFEAWW